MEDLLRGQVRATGSADPLIGAQTDDTFARRQVWSAAAAFWHFFLEPADPRPLGFFRIGVSLIGLVQLGTVWPYLLQLYGNFGFIQWAVIETETDTWLPSIGKICLLLEPWGVSSTTGVYGVFAVYGLCLLGLGLGFRVRVFGTCAWLTHALTVNSGYISLYGVDTMLHICLFYCALMPVGDAYAIRRFNRRVAGVPSVRAGLSQRVLQLHLCIIYLNTGLAKAQGVQWWNGEALWRALMQPQFAVFDMSWLAQVPWIPLVSGWMVILIELGYPFLIWPHRSRPFWVVATVGLHFGIGVTMGLWMFSAIMILMTSSAFGFTWIVRAWSVISDRVDAEHPTATSAPSERNPAAALTE